MSVPRPIRIRSLPVASATSLPDTLDPVLAELYATRGVSDAAELDYSLAGLAPISSLAGIDAAVELLIGHARRHIMVVGDFDADGATSTALVIRCLRDFGFDNVSYLVPNRFEFGYGLTPELVRVAAASSPTLIVTVDNGVSSVEGVSVARDLGIGVLITDHHLPGAELPSADAMLNPNLSGSQFKSPNLAGVGVAFYLMAALGNRLQGEGYDGAGKIPARYLDLVALGTVADVVPLDHNNRILVTQGLKRIRAGRCVQGITALLQLAGRVAKRTVSTDLGFVVGPRLNAAGRMEDMSIGIECLLSDDPSQAEGIARTLDTINRERRSVEAEMREQAYAHVDGIEERNLPSCVCVYEQDWHQGIVGLIAARVRERCHRPVIAFAKETEGLLKGSARSVPGVHIRDLLERIASTRPGLIDKFGGHAMAAGLTMAESRYRDFRAASSACLDEMYPSADFSGAITTDGPLPAGAMNLAFARALREGGPWGSGFPEPVFSGDFELVEQRTVGESHLKIRARPVNDDNEIEAIAFNQAGPAYRGIVRLTYRLDVNEYRGRESPQLIVEQIEAIA